MAPRHLAQEDSWNSVHRSEASDELGEDSIYAEPSATESEDEYTEQQHFGVSSPTLPNIREVQRLLHPLQANADRVGRQVEQFAENLDRLSSRHTSSTDQGSSDYRKVLPSIQAYHKIATDTVKHLRSLHLPINRRLNSSSRSLSQSALQNAKQASSRPGTPGKKTEAGGKTTTADLRRWELEEQTWDLLEAMIQIEYPTPPGVTPSHNTSNAPRPSITQDLHTYSAEEEVWDRFLATDNLAWERHTVINWLNRIADRYDPDMDQIIAEHESDAERGSGVVAHSWLYTREAIKAQKRLRSWPQAFEPDDPGLSTSLITATKSESLVTQLDPDAVTRQQRALERPDLAFEKSIWLACWEMLRRGKQWDEICSWCADRAENWRSAIVNGVSHKPRPRSTADWPSTQLWRQACGFAAKDGGINEYERAVFGLLSGYLPSILPVCYTWADELFAYYSSYQIYSFERFVRTKSSSHWPQQNAGGERLLNFSTSVGQKALSGNQLIEKLKLSEKTAQEALEPFRMLQGSLVARGFDDFVYKHGLRLCQTANAAGRSRVLPPVPEEILEGEKTALISLESHDLFRVVTHMIFVFQDMGYSFGDGDKLFAAESIIVAYIDYLAKAGKIQLLPVYASRLSPGRSTTCLGRQLPLVPEKERETIMRIMQSMRIDIPAALKAQLRLIIEDSPPSQVHKTEYLNLKILEKNESRAMRISPVAAGFIGEVVSEDHLDLIHGYEWYKLLDGYWPQTMALGVMVYKYLLRCQGLAAGIYMAQKIPFSSISVTKTPGILGRAVDLSQADDSDEDNLISPVNPLWAGKEKSRPTDDKHERPRERDSDKVSVASLLARSTSFRDLENLFVFLKAVEDWRKTAMEIQQASQHTQGPSLRRLFPSLKHAFHAVEVAIRPLIQGWLQHPSFASEANEFQQIRLACLPEVVLAYNSIINFSSRYIGRGILQTSMDLAAVVAEDGSDVGSCFMQTGRMPELMDSFSVIAKSMITADAKKAGAKSKDGKTLALFSAKPGSEPV